MQRCELVKNPSKMSDDNNNNNNDDDAAGNGTDQQGAASVTSTPPRTPVRQPASSPPLASLSEENTDGDKDKEEFAMSGVLPRTPPTRSGPAGSDRRLSRSSSVGSDISNRSGSMRRRKEFTISPASIEEDRQRRRMWIKREENARLEEHDRIRQNYENSSNFMLRVVILLWIVIVAGIFWQIWSSVQASARMNARKQGLGL